MGSPFPGMDPWLESPALWPNVHHGLLGAIRDQLQQALRPHFFVDVEERVYVISEDDPATRWIVPDVTVVETATPAPVAQPRGAAQVAAASAEVTLLVEEPVVRERHLVVRSLPGQQVVSVIELLSPSNKLKGSRTREEYLAKRREVLRSDAHLIEIDLLRGGERTPVYSPLPAGEYLVCVSRRERRPQGQVWAWGVREAIPVVPLPLRGQPDARLDLGAALTTLYERAGYDLVIDYRKPPVPALSPEDAAWAAERVGSK